MPRACRKLPICAYADPQVKDLRRLVPAALKRWDEEAIHEARVATRRLRAVLDLVEPLVSGGAVRPLRKGLRRLRRRLGPLRDLDVMIAHLRPLENHRRHRQAARWLSEELVRRRDDERRRARKKRSAADKWLAKLDAWETLRGEVIALGDGVETRMRASLLSQWQSFREQAERLSDHMLDSAAADPIGDADGDGLSLASADPHELRIAGKLLRYTFEMLARTRNRPPAVIKRTFKRMQDELGLWHDHVVLSEWGMRQSLEGLLAHHDPRLQAQVLALATMTLRNAERHLRLFALLWREQGGELSRIVQALPSPPQAMSKEETAPHLFDASIMRASDDPLPDESSSAA